MEREIVEAEPFNAATPLGALDGRIVDADQLYVRCHFDQPTDLAEGYLLTISGLIDRPLQLSIDDLMALPSREQVMTLECAGNGRTVLSPPAPGTPWGFGAAGPARFRGVSVRQVLDLAGYAASAQHLLAIGADSGDVDGHVLPYARSLPMARALHPDTLLAWEMNGAPLTVEHGAPLRLIVPGWYAMASVKWLVELGVRASEFHGWFHEERYCYLGDALAEDGAPVAEIRVRAVIAAPAEGQHVPAGQPLLITGSAWAGSEGIASVSVSTDGGMTFADAELAAPIGPYGPRGWQLMWTPPTPGAHQVVARATDGQGRRQPLQQRWNRLGYGNNVAHAVTVLAGDER